MINANYKISQKRVKKVMNLNLFILILNTIQCIFITDTWAANAKPAVTQKSYFNRVTYPNRLIRTPNSRYSKIKPYIIASNGRKKDSFVQRTSAHLESLLKSIRLGQEKQSTEYTPTITYPPLLHWHQQRGIYKSSVHLNFHGDESKTALRNM